MLNFDVCRSRGVDLRLKGLGLPDGLSFDSWREVGCQVARFTNCSAWWLGDWLVYGEQAYDDRYEQAIIGTSLGYQTLRNYAWVARKFLVSRRRDTRNFGHYAEVTALPDDEQDAWLARTERSNWSRKQLRRELQATRLPKCRGSGADKSVDITALKIKIPIERHQRWQSAAERKNCSVADWIIATLDLALSEDLTIEPPLRFAGRPTAPSPVPVAGPDMAVPRLQQHRCPWLGRVDADVADVCNRIGDGTYRRGRMDL
jgi:hypothetical protein